MTALDVRSDAGPPRPRPRAPGRVTFNRPPRLRPSLSTEKFEVPPPPTPLQKPSQSFASGLIIPLVAVIAMGSLFMFGGFTQTNSTYMVLTVVALLLGSALPTAWLFFEDRRKFRTRAREQVEDHGRRLRNAELELGRLRAEEHDLRNDEDPPPEDLERRALNRGRRLFERRAADPDFLHLRLGPGLAPTRIEVAYTDQRPSDSTDLPLELLNLQREGRHIADQYRQVPDVPIRFDLQRAGAVGFAGRYQDAAPLARSVLCQAAVHHSPDDLRIVGFLGGRPLEDWAWLKWLPHVRNGGAGEAATSLAWDPPSRQALSRWLFDALTSRKRALEEMTGGGEPPFPWLLVFVDDLRSLHADAALRLALADGKRLRIAMLGLADDLASVPGGCGGVAAVEGRGDRGQVSYGESNGGLQPLQCAPDGMDVDRAERIARALAPLVVLDDSAAGQSGDIPARISFFESLGIANVEQLDVGQCWQLSAVPDLLRTPLGPTAGGDLLWLDLKEQSQSGHGPHGLVAGTTGAGKSELLLTVIGGLALHHSPEVLNFVLVDYKGGDAFAAVADLPHTVALITDLDRHLAARALLTLRSEIKRREHRLLEMRAAGVTSLSEYQLRRGDREPMPFLVIVVDEFARLKDDLPEFISGLIDVARVGRSLGVHLILATQTPSGTVDDQIQKNTNFGVCLRVRDAGDSKQVIGEPDAALLPGSLPGRGYFRAGLEPVCLFQTARVGAAYEPRATHATFEVLPFEPLVAGRFRHAPTVAAGSFDTSEVRALVAHLRAAALERGNVATPWPAPLPDVVALLGEQLFEPELGPPALFEVPDLRSEWNWSSPPVASDWLVGSVGLVDEPTQQAQGPFRLDVGRNCLVYGGAGSGKSTLLRTLVTSLAMTHSPRDLHVYCLDFDARTLGVLAGLPHCGESGVFFPRDTVRIRRLIRLLEHELVQRREAGVTNLRQQRRAGGDAAFQRFPFILVVLDNLAAFRETFEEEENLTRSMDSMLSDVASLMRDGPAAGIHFVVTTGSTTSISNAITNAAETRIVLRMTDSGDYRMIGRMEHLPEHVPPGRGFAPGVPPRELQVALLPDDVALATDAFGPAGSAAAATSSASTSRASPSAPLRTADLFACLRRSAGDVLLPAVQDLPRWLSLDDPRLESPSRAGIPIVLGLDDERSQPVAIDLAELLHMLVLGPPGSGKTSLLAACSLQVMNGPRGAAAELYLALPRPSPLSEFAASARCHAIARNVVQLGELLDDLEVVIDERREAMRAHDSDGSNGASDTPDPPRAPVLLVLDDYELLRQDDDFLDLEMRLARLARRGTAVGLHVLVGGSNIELRDARDDLVRYISQLRVGVLLQPDVEFDGDVFTVRLRRMVESAPVGRGYLVVRQHQVLFQSTTPQVEGESLAHSLRARLANLA
jgi:S-DNA-T family DNA segregation ATPase FtsK/SpoIIIE